MHSLQPIFAIALALSVVACARERSAEPPKPAQQPVLLGPESTARVAVRPLRAGPRISGTLEAREQATITAEVSGAVRELNVELGQTVQRGQRLLRIDPGEAPDTVRSARAAVRSAEQALRLAESQAQRTERLVASGALAENQLEVERNAAAAAAAALQQARAQLATAGNTLARSSVRSPMDGVISKQPVHEGDVVSIGSPLLTIIDPSSMRLEAAVPASALPDLAPGTPVEFQVRAAPGQVFEGSIARIAPAADANTGLITILVTIPNTSGHVLAGLFADGRVALEAKDALAIPLSAVDRSTDPPQVTRIRDRVARTVPVELGLLDELHEWVEVRSGLREGDRVALGTAREIVSGTPVQLVGAEAEPSPERGGDATAPPQGNDNGRTAQRGHNTRPE
jgi:RND family efflux transporter MFP subunit